MKIHHMDPTNHEVTLCKRLTSGPIAATLDSSQVNCLRCCGVVVEEHVNGNDLQSEIASVLNRFSAENSSNTPDFILAQYLLSCLAAFNEASRAREKWYGTELRIGSGSLDS